MRKNKAWHYHQLHQPINYKCLMTKGYSMFNAILPIAFNTDQSFAEKIKRIEAYTPIIKNHMP